MTNECQRVITLRALTEIRRILQIEEKIFTIKGAWSLSRSLYNVHCLPESQHTGRYK